MIEIQTTGLQPLLAMLDTVAVKLERSIVRGALRAGAQVILAEAQAQVPEHSGALRKSLRVSVKVKRGVPTATIKAGSKAAWYAHLVEFGTAAHTIKPKKPSGDLATPAGPRRAVHHPGAAKRPFMRPALDAAGAAAVQQYAAYIRRRLTKAGFDLPDES